MTGLTMPPLVYWLVADYSDVSPETPLGSAADPCLSVDEVADFAGEAEDAGRDWRCYEVHFRSDGQPRHIEDCTGRVMLVLADRALRRGYSLEAAE